MTASRMKTTCLAVALSLGLPPALRPQIPAAAVEVTGAVAHPLRLAAADLAAFPRASVETRAASPSGTMACGCTKS